MNQAETKEKPIAGLETMDFQFSLFDSIPYEAQAKMLVDAIKMGDQGDDNINGGDGVDTVVFSGNYSDYAIVVRASGAVVVVDQTSGFNEGRDVVREVEFFEFADQTVDFASL